VHYWHLLRTQSNRSRTEDPGERPESWRPLPPRPGRRTGIAAAAVPAASGVPAAAVAGGPPRRRSSPPPLTRRRADRNHGKPRPRSDRPTDRRIATNGSKDGAEFPAWIEQADGGRGGDIFPGFFLPFFSSLCFFLLVVVLPIEIRRWRRRLGIWHSGRR
jgi:hypothetical protein